ncbi:Bcr/CflA family drug resistance efflux transporter [Pseudoxanthomonas sacheonensis]|nr:multidrug effflux MFS transporter [Pseudoxanthomonas sacheonensis]KAF1706979.1 Bcr/CflA family drug resistance efflux transporter [Pseudoxanthomonas sacheonensis]
MNPGKSTSTRRLTWLLAGLSMLGPFCIDTIFPAFLQMGAQLGVGPLAIQQTISVYLIAYAAMSIVHGPLSDAIGRRSVIIGGMVVFTLASAGCALAKDLPTLLLFRALQGLSAGAGQIVGRAAIRDLFHGDDAQRLMSQVSMLFGIAPAIAPIVGGWILGWGQWPVIFWFLTAFSAVLLLATWFWFPETNPPTSRAPLVARHLARDYAAIFLNPRFQRLAAAGAFNFAGMFLYIASAPVFVMQHLHLGERDFAWLFIPTIGGMVVGSFLSGRAAGRMHGDRLTAIGFAVGGIGAVMHIAYSAFADPFTIPWAVLPLFLTGVGVALVFPILTLSILDMYPRHRGSSSSLQAFTSLVVAALVSGAMSPWLSHNPFHLALGSASLTLLGWTFWRWERNVCKRLPACSDEIVAVEPPNQL